MELKIKNISDLINDKVSLLERGLLITIMLLKDDDSKLTLAKLKAKVKLKDVKNELIHLHELHLIKWSGYKRAIKAKSEEKMNPDVVMAIDFMNDLCGTGFQATSDSTTSNLKNRLSKHSIDDIKLVIANRYQEWRNDPVMCKHLKPTTIFRPSKFDKYLEEALRTKVGESLLNASKINLKKGDVITYEISKQLCDGDIYNIRTFTVEKGKRIGSGRVEKRYGSVIQKSMKIQIRNIESGFGADVEYLYEGK